MKVLIATDGSLDADAALDVIKSRFCDCDNLMILTVADRSENRLFGKLNVTNAEKILERAYGSLIQEIPAHKVEKKLAMGNAGQMIVSCAKDWNADAIVIGTHGHNVINRVMLGSATDYVSSEARCTVIVVRSAPRGNFERILICLDGHVDWLSVIDWVEKEKWSPSAEFKLMTLFMYPLKDYSPNPALDTALFREAEREHTNEAHALVELAIARLRTTLPSNSIQGYVGEVLDVPAAVLEQSKTWNADLIILGPRLHIRWDDQLFHGSVTRSVLSHANCSIELVHGPSKH